MVGARAQAAILLLAALAPAAVSAGWKAGAALPGTPTDLTLADGGTAIVTHSGGAHLVTCGPADAAPTVQATAITDAGAMVGGRVGPGDCLFALSSAGRFHFSDPTCGPTPTLLSVTAGRGFVRLPSGGGFAIAGTITLTNSYYSAEAGLDGGWQGASFVGAPTAFHLGGTTAGGQDWLVYSQAGSTNLSVKTTSGSPLGGPTLNDPVSSLSVFERGGAPAVLVAFADGGLALRSDARDGGSPFVAVPAAPTGVSRGIFFTEDEGDGFGRGFGLAGTPSGMYGAVPNPAAPGMVWLVRPEATVSSNLRTRCFGPQACALVAEAPDTVYWYFNRGPPETLDGGQVRFFADAGDVFTATLPVRDFDRDPFWVTWGDSGTLAISPSGAPQNETATFSVPASVACGRSDLEFVFWASDGWAQHTRQFTGAVEVTRNEPPGAASIDGTRVQVFAGLGAVFLPYTAPTAGCPPTRSFATVTGSGFTVDAGPGGYLIAPDPSFCAVDGGGRLTVTNENDAGSRDSVVSISVVPWGAPTMGAFTPGPAVELDAGSAVSLGALASHPCQAASGFPGLEYFFSVDGGGPTVTVTPSPDGGLVVTSTDACVAAQLSVSAQAAVRGEDAGRSSAGTASVAISVVPNFPPVTPGEFDAGIEYDPARNVARGFVTLTAACAAQRGFEARLSVYGSAGAVISGPARVGIPGPWELGVPGGCSGGDFFVKAELLSGGSPTGIEQLQSFATTFRPAGVASVSPSNAQVRCGDAVGFTVTAEPIANACGSQEYLWRQAAGPAVALQNASGRQVEVASVAEFDDLGGAIIELEVSTDAGQGNVGRPVRQEIVLQPAPFVQLEHSFEPLPALEGEVVPVRAALRNTSGCDVTGLRLREVLGRLRYVEGSARVNGARALASLADGVLEIGPVDLAAGRGAVVTWLARAPLSSAPAVSGEVTMRGSPVTLPPPAPLPAGCGCGSAPAWVGSALLSLAGLFKRRRPRYT